MQEVKVMPDTFNKWSKNMVRYGLQAGLGQTFTNDAATSVLYQLGNFLFPAGQSDSQLWRAYSSQYSLADRILISEDASWQDFLQAQPHLYRFTRYAFSDQADFDTKLLEKWQSSLPEEYCLFPIDEQLYHQLAQEEWSRDLQGDFSGFEEFQQAGGFGFVILAGQEVIAAVSTGLVYQGAIEIEIATKPSYQRQGLAKVLGAAMILKAQKRSVFPLWDAHNEASKKVAQSLGYRLLGSYSAYEVKEAETCSN